jgi:hypothetical protein
LHLVFSLLLSATVLSSLLYYAKMSNSRGKEQHNPRSSPTMAIKEEQNSPIANVRQPVQSHPNQVTLPFRSQPRTRMDAHPKEEFRTQPQAYSVQMGNNQDDRMQQIRQQHLSPRTHPSATQRTPGHVVAERQGGDGMPLQHYKPSRGQPRLNTTDRYITRTLMPQQPQQKRLREDGEKPGVCES